MAGGIQTRKTKISPTKCIRIPLNDVWKLDLKNLTWESLGNLPEYEVFTWGVSFSACCLGDNESVLHVFGGTKICLKEGVKDVKMNSLFCLDLGVISLQKICKRIVENK